MWTCESCHEERTGMFCATCYPTYAVQLATHVRQHLEDGIIDPLEMLTAMQARPVYAARIAKFGLSFITHQMRLLTRDTTRLARDLVKAHAAQLAADVIRDGDPKDKTALLRGVQVLGEMVQHQVDQTTRFVVETHSGPAPKP
jgi:hypothetical protein